MCSYTTPCAMKIAQSTPSWSNLIYQRAQVALVGAWLTVWSDSRALILAKVKPEVWLSGFRLNVDLPGVAERCVVELPLAVDAYQAHIDMHATPPRMCVTLPFKPISSILDEVPPSAHSCTISNEVTSAQGGRQQTRRAAVRKRTRTPFRNRRFKVQGVKLTARRLIPLE